MDEKPYQVITPNILKSLFTNLIRTGLPVVIFTLILLIGKEYINFSLISDSFKIFGFELDFENLYQKMIELIALIGMIIVLINTLLQSSNSLQLYSDRVIFRKGLETTHILPDNVVSINYSHTLLPKLLHSGCLEMKISGQGKGNLEMDFITDVEKTTSKLQEWINRFKYNSQSNKNQKV